jgi:hypothetical protein
VNGRAEFDSDGLARLMTGSRDITSGKVVLVRVPPSDAQLTLAQPVGGHQDEVAAADAWWHGLKPRTRSSIYRWLSRQRSRLDGFIADQMSLDDL